LTALPTWFSLGSNWKRTDVHIGQMQVRCPKRKVIVAIGLDQVVLGECRELRGTVAGDAKNMKSARS
jgi:hypothetical protein